MCLSNRTPEYIFILLPTQLSCLGGWSQKGQEGLGGEEHGENSENGGSIKCVQSKPHVVIEILQTIQNCYHKFMCFINIYNDLNILVVFWKTTELPHSHKQLPESYAKPSFQLLFVKVTLVGYKCKRYNLRKTNHKTNITTCLDDLFI